MIDQRSVNARISELESKVSFLAEMVASAISGNDLARRKLSRGDHARLAEIATDTCVEPWEVPSFDPESDEPHDDLSTTVRPA